MSVGSNKKPAAWFQQTTGEHQEERTFPMQTNSTTTLDPENTVSPALAALREILASVADAQDDTAILTDQAAHLGGDFDVWGGWQLMEGEVM